MNDTTTATAPDRMAQALDAARMDASACDDEVRRLAREIEAAATQAVTAIDGSLQLTDFISGKALQYAVAVAARDAAHALVRKIEWMGA